MYVLMNNYADKHAILQVFVLAAEKAWSMTVRYNLMGVEYSFSNHGFEAFNDVNDNHWYNVFCDCFDDIADDIGDDIPMLKIEEYKKRVLDCISPEEFDRKKWAYLSGRKGENWEPVEGE